MRATLFAAMPLTLLLFVACGAPAPPPEPVTRSSSSQTPPSGELSTTSPAASGQPAPFSLNVKPLPPAEKTPDPGLPLVRELTQQFYRGELAKLHKKFSSEMKTTMPIEKLEALRTRVEKEYGKETAVLGEDWQTRGNYRGFVRWARFDGYTGVIEVLWMLHKDDDQVAGLFIQPAQNQDAKK